METKITAVLPMLLGAIIAAYIIYSFSNQTTKFENVALGEETSSYRATDGDFPIHHFGIVQEEDSIILAGWQSRGKKPVVFFLGNSQSHSINKMQKQEVNYVELLHKQSEFAKVDILANSIPNANLQEFYLLYAYYANIYPIHCLFVPIFLDDMRETGIREYYFKEMLDVPAVIQRDTSTIAQKIKAEVVKIHVQKAANGDMAALDKTMQASSEEYLDTKMGEASKYWRNRDQMRGYLFNSLYIMRNTALGINAQTKRKMIPANYRDNIEALTAIIHLAQTNKAQIVLYIPPLRQDVAPPYAPAEYTSFKKEIETLAAKSNCEFVNLEGIVPGKYWGNKGSTNTSGKPEYDFMHFQFAGHRLLADSLTPILQRIIK